MSRIYDQLKAADAGRRRIRVHPMKHMLTCEICAGTFYSTDPRAKLCEGVLDPCADWLARIENPTTKKEMNMRAALLFGVTLAMGLYWGLGHIADSLIEPVPTVHVSDTID